MYAKRERTSLELVGPSAMLGMGTNPEMAQ